MHLQESQCAGDTTAARKSELPNRDACLPGWAGGIQDGDSRPGRGGLRAFNCTMTRRDGGGSIVLLWDWGYGVSTSAAWGWEGKIR